MGRGGRRQSGGEVGERVGKGCCDGEEGAGWDGRVEEGDGLILCVCVVT